MAEKARQRSRPRTSAKRLVLVDDHPLFRQGLAAALSREPDLNVCAEAGSYDEAIAAAEREGPDLMLVDLSLGDRGGLELIKQLRALHPEILILVVSVHNERVYAERSLQAGARGYVMKSEGAGTVLAATREILGGGLYVSSAISGWLLGRYMNGGQAAPGSRVAKLSDRELEVFEYIGRGLSTREVAEKLVLSHKTVESHRQKIKAKLGLGNGDALVHYATHWILTEHGTPPEDEGGT